MKILKLRGNLEIINSIPKMCAYSHQYCKSSMPNLAIVKLLHLQLLLLSGHIFLNTSTGLICDNKVEKGRGYIDSNSNKSRFLLPV